MVLAASLCRTLALSLFSFVILGLKTIQHCTNNTRHFLFSFCQGNGPAERHKCSCYILRDINLHSHFWKTVYIWGQMKNKQEKYFTFKSEDRTQSSNIHFTPKQGLEIFTVVRSQLGSVEESELPPITGTTEGGQ